MTYEVVLLRNVNKKDHIHSVHLEYHGTSIVIVCHCFHCASWCTV